MQNVKLSLVIPAYNEASIIQDTIEQCLVMLTGSFADFELIISDDGSTDKTRELVESLSHPRLRLVSHFPNKGKGAAVREGIMAAAGDVIVYTDADLAYGTYAVSELADKLLAENTDLAIGSRKLHPDGYSDYPAIRLLASRCFSFVTGLLAGFQYDTQCGIKAFKRDAAKAVLSRCTIDGFAFDFEVMMLSSKLGLSVAQLPVKIVNHRDSKVSMVKDSIKMLKDVVGIRSSVNRRMKEERQNES